MIYNGDFLTAAAVTEHQFTKELPRDCADIQTAGATVSGVYRIVPASTNCQFEVYCDFNTDGGGWTVRTNLPPSISQLVALLCIHLC